VRFLQHGLQGTEIHIRILLLVTGIDSLLMANGVNEFCSRIENLLGPEFPIFPSDRYNRQPGYKVGEVGQDLYELRSEIAHGRGISKRFREPTGFLDSSGAPLSTAFATYRYRHVLEECAAFLLCQAIRKVVTTDLIVDIENEKRWRQRLRTRIS